MKTKYLLLLSEIIDKMDIKEELQNLDFNTGDEKEDRDGRQENGRRARHRPLC